MKLLLVSLIALSACTPAIAEQTEYDPGGSSSRTCYRSEYREEYVPGTENDPGYVKSWKETVEVPCNDDVATGTKVYRKTVVEYDIMIVLRELSLVVC